MSWQSRPDISGKKGKNKNK